MRVLFDTSALVDGALESGAARRAFKEVMYGRIQLVTSEVILGELRATMVGRDYHYPQIVAEMFCKGLADRDNVTVVTLHDVPRACPGDPMDDHVLAAAAEGAADIIVATDHHLKDMKTYRGIRIVSPEEFLVTTGIVHTLAEAERLNHEPPKRTTKAPNEGGTRRSNRRAGPGEIAA